jgi:phospholipase C
MHRALSAALGAFLLFLSLTGSRLALAQGGLQRVNHIIIVMQENHSFDNYFGALAYAPGSPYHNAHACPVTTSALTVCHASRMSAET